MQWPDIVATLHHQTEINPFSLTQPRERSRPEKTNRSETFEKTERSRPEKTN
jgi:hypothetical protein